MILEAKNIKLRVALFILSTLAGLGFCDAVPAETSSQRAQFIRITEFVSAIRQLYVDPVDDRRLVLGCREGMKSWVGERAHVDQPAGSGTAISNDALEEMRASFTRIAIPLSSEEDQKRLAAACIRGMVREVDRHGEYLDREDFRELQVGTPELGAVGVELTVDAGLPKIVFSIEGTPAYRAGLKSGDHIAKIDDTPSQGVALKEVIRRLRGEPRSTVRLTIVREGERAPVELTLTREVIRVESVRWRLITGGYAHVRIARFAEDTLESLAVGLQSAYRASDNELPGVILDLRNNQGGLLTACVGVSGAFLPVSALVVQTRGRTADASRRYYARPEDYLRGTRRDPVRELPRQIKSVPVIVLVNSKSAACSEIVVAALQDHGRAKILGSRTVGRGTVQTIMPMGDNTALKLTTARFFRPNGQAIESVGVAPDVAHQEDGAVLPEFGSANDPELSKAIAVLADKPSPLAR
jgi:carboxyl-terminal processing protease